MNVRRWIVGGGVVVLAGAAVLFLRLRQNIPPLPVPTWSSYRDASAPFVAALREAQARASARPREPEAVRGLARLYQANRRFDEARVCYALLPASALTARDHYYLADLAVEAEGDLRKAVAELGAAVKLDSGYGPARLLSGDMWFKLGESNRARTEYEAVLATVPGDVAASVGIARIDIADGKIDAAVSRLEDVMANHPEATSAAAVLAGLLQRRGETDRAVALTEWSRQKPEPIPPDPWRTDLLLLSFDVQRLGLQAEAYARTGQLAEAKPLLARIEQIDPTSPVPALLRATAALQAHDASLAVQQFQASLAKGGDPEKICPQVATTLLADGKLDAAAAFISPYAARFPGSIPILTASAEVAMRRGDTTTARAALTAVLKKDPGLYAQNMALARILWSTGDRDGAAAYLRQAAAADATEVPARALLGEYLVGRQELPGAIAQLEQAWKNAKLGSDAHRQLTETLAGAYAQAADAEAQQGRTVEAIRHYETAMKIAPNDPRPLAGKANACVQRRDFVGAAEALKRLIAIDPTNPTVYLSLGDVLYQAGDADGAKSAWGNAVKRAGAGDDDLRRALTDRLSGKIDADTFK